MYHVCMSDEEFQKQNIRAWNRLAKKGDRLARKAKPEDLVDPLATVDGAGWLGGSVYGKSILCLAAGGGRQGPIYAKAGGVVTVVDLSPEMLKLDREAAQELGLKIQTIETTMEDLSPIRDSSFDIVIHPVSTCYIPDPRPVFVEVARVLKPTGLYISQHKQPTSLQSGLHPIENNHYSIEYSYFRSAPLPTSKEPNLIREDGTHEWIHRWEVLIGGICAAGMIVEDLKEPFHAERDAKIGSFAHRSQFIAPYVRIKARKSCNGNSTAPTLFTP